VHVLIIDDDASVRRALELELSDHRLVVAAGHGEALAVLRGSAPIDVVLSDLQLGPGPDGLAVCAAAQQLRPTAPRILLTGSPDHPGVGAALAAGTIARVLVKPWRPGEIAASLRVLR
jgi:CheY-like chemotaxis protein